MTVWSNVTRTVFSWLQGYLLRHTYGAEYGTTTRIRYGDNVRYGGQEDLDEITQTSWS